MKDVLIFLQNIGTLGFLVLGLVTAIGRARRRANPFGFLALAIVLLALVRLLGRAPTIFHFTRPWLNQISVVGFMGSAYALLRYRSSIIPLGRGMHLVAIVGIIAATVIYLVSSARRHNLGVGKYPESAGTDPRRRVVRGSR